MKQIFEKKKNNQGQHPKVGHNFGIELSLISAENSVLSKYEQLNYSHSSDNM